MIRHWPLRIGEERKLLMLRANAPLLTRLKAFFKIADKLRLGLNDVASIGGFWCWPAQIFNPCNFVVCKGLP